MDKKKLITFLLALTMILSLTVGASAAETTEARVPVTLTVVNTVSPISCTVPACLPVSLRLSPLYRILPFLVLPQQKLKL